MSRRQRNTAQMEHDLAEVSRLRLEGFTIDQIVEKTGRSRSTVERDWQRVKKRWRREQVETVGMIVETSLEKIALVERNAFTQFNRSVTDTTEKSLRKTTKPLVARTDGGDTVQVGTAEETSQEVKSKAQFGNPKYLEIILRCVEQRMRTAGMEPPTKIQVDTPKGVAALMKLLED